MCRSPAAPFPFGSFDGKLLRYNERKRKDGDSGTLLGHAQWGSWQTVGV
jgi:hypothetical protein